MSKEWDDIRGADGKLPAYAWPGGYPLVYITEEGLTVCALCASKDDDETSDPVVGYQVHWEGEAETCEDCGAEIESAYGEVEESNA